MWYEGADTATRRWLHADERGSIVAVSDASGAMFAINTYDEYGNPAAASRDFRDAAIAAQIARMCTAARLEAQDNAECSPHYKSCVAGK